MANSAFSDATHAANRHSDIAITSVASNDILKFDGTNWVNSTTSPDSSISVTQSSHGFAVGEALKSSGSNGAYAKAQADSAANAEVVGIVTVVTDSNNFTLTLNGMIRIAGAVPNETAGTALFLSAGTAGALTATEPSTSGQISKPVAIVTTANSEMVLVTYRGETISTGVTNWDVNGLELVLDADGDTTLHASTDDQIDVKISGADDFRFSANNFNILSGSTITIDSGATITNSGTANGFGGGNSFTNDVTVTSGNVVMATSGKGIDFSAQSGPASGMTSELLDRYEEGTWTPAIADGNNDGSGESQTYNIQRGYYTRTGDVVHAFFYLGVTSIGSLGTGEQARIVGWPFSSVNATQFSSAAAMQGVTLDLPGAYAMTGLMIDNASFLLLYIWDASGGTTALTINELYTSGAAELRGVLTYRV